METPGSEGSPTPITFQFSATRCTQYLSDGTSCTRCGSFANSGKPLAVSLPLTTQLLLPMSCCRVLRSSAESSEVSGSNLAGVFGSLRYSAISSYGVNLMG